MVWFKTGINGTIYTLRTCAAITYELLCLSGLGSLIRWRMSYSHTSMRSSGWGTRATSWPREMLSWLERCWGKSVCWRPHGRTPRSSLQRGTKGAERVFHATESGNVEFYKRCMVKAKDNTENNSCYSVMRYSITLHKNREKELMWRWYFSFFKNIF